MKNSKSLTIIGLGPMGQAITRTYLAKGYKVTVWNRTATKAKAMAEEGAIHAQTVEKALNESQLVFIILTEYDQMYQVLNNFTNNLSGKTLVNLSSDTPENARKAARWAAEHGAGFLSGGMMADPPMIGNPEAYIIYSGSQALLNAHKATLEVIARVDYKGDDPGLSQAFYQAVLDILFTGAMGTLHALALVRAEGIAATAFEPYMEETLNTLSYYFRGMAAEVDAEKYNGEQNNMNMMAAGMRHVAQASRDAGIHTKLSDLISEIYDQTVAMGYGKEGLTSIIEILKKDR